ncbi:ParB N-terminal domain-containing protein [Streptomyces sp. NRRL F-5755]|uniref:ParB N-terminal domain-containing protein n=1 Tax=Streptomyces sp. NRRL F-5755 TaxID=1519475 RepID=UPI0006B01D94|nr:ParB N-terminal domain-containing protein [Streptomyces sp. NRRL F-5755]
MSISRIPASLADLAVPVDQLAAYRRNPRTGDLDAFAESLSTNGQYQPFVINKSSPTGRLKEVLAGGHTLKGGRSVSAGARTR